MDRGARDGGAVLSQRQTLSLVSRAAGWLILLLGCAGCDLERGDSGWQHQVARDTGLVDMGQEDFGLGQGPGAGTMSGTWLMLHEGSTCVLGDEQLTHAWYLIEIDQIGRSLEERRRICRLDLSPVLGLRVIIPETTRQAINFIDYDRGLVSDLRVGGSYTSSLELALWGVELEDPISDELPANADDPRVVDADDDGNPAVTFEIDGSSCLRFAGQRQAIRYSGTFETPNAIAGTSINVTDVKAYGSTEVLCGIAPPILSNDAHSRFRMVRVDGLGGTSDLDTNRDGAISCEEATPAFLEVMERRGADRERCRR